MQKSKNTRMENKKLRRLNMLKLEKGERKERRKIKETNVKKKIN